MPKARPTETRVVRSGPQPGRPFSQTPKPTFCTISFEENDIYEGIPYGNVKLAHSEIFLMLNLIHSESSVPSATWCAGVRADSRKLDKQRVLPKKGLRLLTIYDVGTPSPHIESRKLD